VVESPKCKRIEKSVEDIIHPPMLGESNAMKLSLGGWKDFERLMDCCSCTSLFAIHSVVDGIVEVRGSRTTILRVGVGEDGVRIVAVATLLVLSIGIKPCVIPIAQENFDFGVQTEVLYVASDSLPLNGALVKTLLYVGKVSKIHPVNEEME